MNDSEFDKIVERAYQKLEPSLDRQIERYRESTNPEIVNGLYVLEVKRERIRIIIAEALAEYSSTVAQSILKYKL
jgi:hypothetical protein